MPFVILQISSGAKVLKPWYGCVVPATSTVADVFTDFSSGVIGSGNAIPDEYRPGEIVLKNEKMPSLPNFLNISDDKQVINFMWPNSLTVLFSEGPFFGCCFCHMTNTSCHVTPIRLYSKD